MKLLPLLCLLSPWFGPGSAQEISKKCDDVTVAEGDDALLPCSFGPEQAIEKFDWIKDKDMPNERKEVILVEGFSHDKNKQDTQFRDRVLFFEEELHAGNASIKITTTRLEDSGNYTCVLLKPILRAIHIRLNVGAAPEPIARPIKGANTWSLLECKVQGVPKPEVEWRKGAGEVLLADEITISVDGRFQVTKLVNVTSTDVYTCVATQTDICHKITSTMYQHFSASHSVWTESHTGWIIGSIGFVLLVVSY